MTPKSSRNSTCRKYEWNIDEAVEQEERSCDEMETVIEFTYFRDRVSANGGCEVAVTTRTRCGWAKFMECSELLHDRLFPPKLKGVVNKSYIRLAILYGSGVWCLKESEMEIF